MKAKILNMIRFDGWSNILTGLGRSGRDKRTGSKVEHHVLTEMEVEELYAADDMAERIVDTLPDEMVREWFTLTDPSLDPKVIDAVQSKLDALCAKSVFQEALSVARMYGGSGIVLGVADGKDVSEPLDPRAVRDIEYLTVLNRYELLAELPINSDVGSKNFNKPDYYRIAPRTGSVATGEITHNSLVHHSRILRFDGAYLPRRLYAQNSYWHDSVLSKLYNPLRNYHGTHDSLAALLQDFSQAVFKIKDLGDIVGSDDGLALIQKRLAAVDLGRSVLNAVLIGDEEEFARKATPMTGLKDAVQLVNMRLVSATGMPHTLLLGESPSGLGATGDSEKTDWYDFVARQQEVSLRPNLEELLKIVFLSRQGPTRGREPEGWDVEFNSLWQPEQKDELENRKRQAEVDKIYIETQVLSPEEVAVSRFSTGKFEFETTMMSGNDGRGDPSQEDSDRGPMAPDSAADS